MKEKVILAYSGGLDTSIIIPWIKENYDLDIIAACINVGQDDDMSKVEEKAIKSGASKAYIENVVDEFVSDYVYKAIKANAVYEDKYLMGTSIARPLIGKKLVEIAHKEGAKYIAHGCTGKGNDQVRFEAAIAALDPSIKVIAPWRIWDISSREDAIDYANEKGIEIPVTKEKIYSRDMNLMHISHEGGAIEDPKNEQPEDLYIMTKTLEDAKDEAEYVELYFENGEAVKLNGKEMKPSAILAELNKIGGEHGIGIEDILENRLVGMKSRGIYETPGATILMSAHKELEHLCLDKLTYQYKQMLSLKYAELVYNGTWFCQLREALDAFIDKTQETVTGWVKLKLYKGNIIFAGMDSPYALYEHSISSFGASDFYDQKDATGFINIFNLPLKIQAMTNKKNEK
ncbi:argininosuccinate synthase [Peptoclostridium litorale DSM 5388]|uniref:Argininosuccinate synthase n=1 Tax=Peptoclostridium litorale DSM 5388 TaxID=1121324 RepID=A0A069RGU3_PEPLI|nr:argininosuccinate synthase [Peptoclostridium litorale]KDR96008.1 argininosuccinate synthase ArgG [Peptoclostridium litorale DSM 5388]SIO06752.1 argininosuccinate synthase [Peptoclostridium litorale DSM 5388]